MPIAVVFGPFRQLHPLSWPMQRSRPPKILHLTNFPVPLEFRLPVGSERCCGTPAGVQDLMPRCRPVVSSLTLLNHRLVARDDSSIVFIKKCHS